MVGKGGLERAVSVCPERCPNAIIRNADAD
jgi:hypothetical protein